MLDPSHKNINVLSCFGAANLLDEAKVSLLVSSLPTLTALEISGVDAVNFLHRLVTVDIVNLPLNRVIKGGICTSKGRLVASPWIYRVEKGEVKKICLVLLTEVVQIVLLHLKKFVLRDKVTFCVDSTVWYGALIGDKTDASVEQFLAELGTISAGSVVESQGVEVLSLPSIVWETRLLLRLSNAPSVSAESIRDLAESQLPKFIKSVDLGSDSSLKNSAWWHAVGFAAGIPEMTITGVEKWIPQSLNLDLIGGIDFKKGCYPGQEIVARTHYLGQAKRRAYLAYVSPLVTHNNELTGINIQTDIHEGDEVLNDKNELIGSVINVQKLFSIHPSYPNTQQWLCLLELKVNENLEVLFVRGNKVSLANPLFE